MWHLFTGTHSLLSLTPSQTKAPSCATVVSLDGTAIAYEVHGNADPTLVLVHGWSNNRTFWEPHTLEFARTHRVATLDLAGHGESGDTRQNWCMRNFGEDVAAVAQTLPSNQLVLVGFSMGGGAVLEAASIVPEKVKGIVLVDVYKDIEEKTDDASIEDWIAGLRAGWRNPDVIWQALFSPEAPAALVQRFFRSTPDTPPDSWWQAIRGFFAHLNSGDLARTISQISAPIAAINSGQGHTNIAAFRKYAPSFTVATIPEVGHLGVLWEKADLFADLLMKTIEQFSQEASGTGNRPNG